MKKLGRPSHTIFQTRGKRRVPFFFLFLSRNEELNDSLINLNRSASFVTSTLFIYIAKEIVSRCLKICNTKELLNKKISFIREGKGGTNETRESLNVIR